MTESLTYIEFKSLLGESKRKSDPIFCRFILRPLSFPVGWLFYKSGMKANMVSFLSILITLIASFMIVSAEKGELIFASLLMLFVALTDCIDGNIARARKETGPSGEWMDALSGYSVYVFIPVSLGLHLNFFYSSDFFSGFWILVSSVAVISNLYMRLIYQKYINAGLDVSSGGEIKATGSLFSKLSGEVGLVGWMMPALCVASLLELLPIYLLFYGCFYLLSALAVFYSLISRVSPF
tara:strand:- start:33 stop:746 length:714 start_codon:yes stop_codon:yes gene_type:complete